MGFPRKFKDLLEIELEDVAAPDYCWLTYSVCGCEPDSCGWGGWTIEVAAQFDENGAPRSAHKHKLTAVNEQKCPDCGKETFRTGATIRLEKSADQEPELKPGVDYELAPIKYDD